eukprot:Nitzschia sp. Nitz4//scaffold403_size10707//9185//10144//NITZ4_009065-RA/size10707-processed-gene-0.8-mRNA-1//-1//CDS//3329551092//3818//frame0
MTTSTMFRLSPIWTCLFGLCLVSIRAQTQLTSGELYQGMMNGMFDAVLDVRTQAEWDLGHIPNVTFVEELYANGTADSILSCDLCIIAVTCGSGKRAGMAIERLINEFGFDADNVYNGLGTGQWVTAGYELVNTTSQVAPCQETGVCMAGMTVAPTEAPTRKQLTSEELYQGMMDGMFDAVLDVRTQAEWDLGHIPNATFVEELFSTGSADAILSCDLCVIAVTCGSGKRAGMAIERLINEFGFDADNVYNGLGTGQWVTAGYELVNTTSQVAPCQDSGICMADMTIPPTGDETGDGSGFPMTSMAIFVSSLVGWNVWL